MVTVGWNRSTDEFTLGQWLYGRIEGTHADIAPDGKHWIYGVLDPRRSRVLGDRKRAAWTAIALTPYLKAISLAFNRAASAGLAESLFLDNRRIWRVGDSWPAEDFGPLHPDFELGPRPSDLGKQEPRYFYRLRRDGWKEEREARSNVSPEMRLKTEEFAAGFRDRLREQFARISKIYPDHVTPDYIVPEDVGARYLEEVLTQRFWTRELPNGWMLEKHKESGEVRGTESHRLVNPAAKRSLDYPLWEWADWDAFGQRVIWAENGFVRGAIVTDSGLGPAADLFDTNPLRFEPLVAPYETDCSK
jgi:hypothetical protein